MPGCLHLTLDSPTSRSLVRRAGTVGVGPPARWPERWVFLDTAQGALRQAGVALVLVRRGRTWTHRLVWPTAEDGPWSPSPVAWPAPVGRADLSALPDPNLRKRLARLLAKDPVGPAGEASVRRTVWTLPEGGQLCHDRIALAGPDGTGVILTHATLAPAGASALAAAAALLPDAGERMGAGSPEIAARAALAGAASPSPLVRHAHPVPLAPDQSATSAATAVLRECAAQVRANVVALRAGAGSEAPHQLRVGLRRLRAALRLFDSVLFGPETERLASEARGLAGDVGVLRDLDAMLEDVVGPEAAAHPDEPGFVRLADALRRRGDGVRADLVRALAGARVQRFLIDLALFAEGTGWPDAHAAAGAAPSARTIGRAALARRWKKTRKLARDFDRMDTEARHTLRKELKKLRYGAEFLGPLFPPRQVVPFTQRLKVLQEVFGTLNDAATAEALLSGPDAPASRDPAAARAAGRVIGARIARAEQDWTRAQALWRKLERTRPFWDGPA